MRQPGLSMQHHMTQVIERSSPEFLHPYRYVQGGRKTWSIWHCSSGCMVYPGSGFHWLILFTWKQLQRARLDSWINGAWKDEGAISDNIWIFLLNLHIFAIHMSRTKMPHETGDQINFRECVSNRYWLGPIHIQPQSIVALRNHWSLAGWNISWPAFLCRQLELKTSLKNTFVKENFCVGQFSRKVVCELWERRQIRRKSQCIVANSLTS